MNINGSDVLHAIFNLQNILLNAILIVILSSIIPDQNMNATVTLLFGVAFVIEGLFRKRDERIKHGHYKWFNKPFTGILF